MFKWLVVSTLLHKVMIFYWILSKMRAQVHAHAPRCATMHVYLRETQVKVIFVILGVPLKYISLSSSQSRILEFLSSFWREEDKETMKIWNTLSELFNTKVCQSSRVVISSCFLNTLLTNVSSIMEQSLLRFFDKYSVVIVIQGFSSYCCLNSLKEFRIELRSYLLFYFNQKRSIVANIIVLSCLDEFNDSCR